MGGKIREGKIKVVKVREVKVREGRVTKGKVKVRASIHHPHAKVPHNKPFTR